MIVDVLPLDNKALNTAVFAADVIQGVIPVAAAENRQTVLPCQGTEIERRLEAQSMLTGTTVQLV